MDFASESVRRVLRQSGWSEGRAVADADILAALSGCGLPVSDASLAALRSLAGIRVDMSATLGGSPGEDSGEYVSFVLADLCREFTPDVLEYIAELHGDGVDGTEVKVFPVGIYDDGYWPRVEHLVVLGDGTFCREGEGYSLRSVSLEAILNDTFYWLKPWYNRDQTGVEMVRY